jgi:hypothetical protein
MRRDDGETALALFVGPGWVPRKLGRGNCRLAKHLSRDNGWTGYLTGKNSTQGGDR